MITQNHNLNLIPESTVPVVVHVKQYDKGSRTLNFKIFNGSSVFSIPSGTTAKIQGLKPDGTVFEYSMTVSSPNVSINIQEQMTVVPGLVLCEVILMLNGDVLGTANFVLDVEVAPINYGAISESDIPALKVITDGGVVGQFLEWGEDGVEWADSSNTYISDAQIDALFS